ncbi:response regulator [Limnoglobus roseus]|uniref:Response regulator n=1 Tax=Limnoglobus roseus TaxID=2598579 RepID=A0A5C1AML3_9BACT|nr:response regulator [Limnoglobus roseus]QEL20491.1 response regulator [Limnoglobus roseus]
MKGPLPYVLVVDDLRDTADSTADLLALWGYDAAPYYDGDSALAAAARRPPDVVLLDIGMAPMNGFVFAARLRGVPGCERTGVVIVSGYTSQEYRARARDLGAGHFLPKPTDPNALRALVARLVTPRLTPVRRNPSAAEEDSVGPAPAAPMNRPRQTRFEDLRLMNPPTATALRPYGRGDPGPSSVPALVRNGPERPVGILVVDDDDGIRAVLAAGLERHGFSVWPAADGREAVAHHRVHHASIDLALLDVLMPGRDGPETLHHLRQFAPHLSACFMTADAGRYTERDLFALGPLAVFRKPFDVVDMAGRLAGLVADVAAAKPGCRNAGRSGRPGLGE